MKKLLLVAAGLLLITGVVSAQKDKDKSKDKKVKPMRVHEVVYAEPPAKFDMKSFEGKWLETERTNSGGSKVSFTDSLMLSISNGNGFIKSTGTMDMVMRGEAQIILGDVLNIAGTHYKVQAADGSRVVISDQGNTRVLKPVTAFYYEQPKTSVKKDTYDSPLASVDIQNLNGKWEVFKKQATPGFITKETKLIKWISFTNTTGEAGTGEMLTYAGTATPAIEVFEYRVADGALQIKTKTAETTMMVYKADGAELVFGKAGELLNFGRPVK